MVIGNQYIAAQGIEFLHAVISGNTVIHSNDELMATCCHIVDKVLLDAMRFQIAIGNVVTMPLISAGVQILIQDIGTGDAIRIVVPEDHHRFVVINGFMNARSHCVDIGKQRFVG